jgi:hypothetical protein
MCGGVLFRLDGEQIRTFIPNSCARLPVRIRDGGGELMP